MNKKFLSAALALPLVFAACTDDLDVVKSQENEVAINGEKFELSENFVLAGGVSEHSSRLAWVTGGTLADGADGSGTQFMWIPKGAGNVTVTDLSLIPTSTIDAIGLCYVHGGEIMTNYKFLHDGWVEWGQEMSNIPFQCVEGVRYYDRNYLRFNKLSASTIINMIGDATQRSVKGQLDAPVNSQIDSKDKSHEIEYLNLTRGIFKTEEKTIFAGDYVTYYPWTDGILEAGNLIATGNTVMTYESGQIDNRVNALNKYTFFAGYLTGINGGTEAAEMKFDQVSKLLKLNANAFSSTANKIVLLDASTEAGNFISKMELTPEQIKASNYNGTVTETSQTVAVDFNTAIQECFTVGDVTTHSVVYVPMFKTTIPANSYVLYIDNTTGAATYAQNAEAINMTDDLVTSFATNCLELKDFAYDVVTNKQELLDANATLSTKPILLLGDIELDVDVTLTKKLVGYLNGVKVGSLILPAADGKYLVKAKDLSFDCDVLVQAPGCCHNYGGKMNLYGVTLEADRTFTNANVINFREGHTNHIYGTLNNTPFVAPDEEGLTYTYMAPEMSIEKKAVVYVYGELNNNDADAEGIQSLITINSDDAVDKKDGELSVVSSGKIANNALIHNYGTMSNQTGKAENIMNNEGATYVLKIGGQLTGALLKNAENRRCDFIAEVDNAADSRWSTAWSQGLANIIKIVSVQNPTYTTALDYVYPFQFTLNNGETMTVNNKNVQVIVENPSVYFVGKKTTGTVETFTPVTATIGRLLINNTGTTTVNFQSKKNNDGTYKTIEPLQLVIDDATWAGNECAAGEAVNAVNVAKGTLTHNNYQFTTKADMKALRLTVRGNFDVATNFEEKGMLSQKGNLTAVEGGKILFDKEARFSIEGEILSADAQGDENHGIIIEERVIGDLTKGNITVNENSFILVHGDAVINVAKNVVNNGKMKWVSRTGTKSPGVVYCAEFVSSNPANWVNGTPTLK